MKYMVDTNIINWLVDGSLSTGDFANDASFVATHIQHDELSKTRDSKRRELLLDRFTSLVDSTIPTESAIVGISKLDSCRIGDGILYGQLKSDLDSLNHCKDNNSEDALIAEAAIVNSHTLITADEDLRTVAEQHGCNVAPLTIYKTT
jgi:predicted nucleic acid-binding protein